MPFSLTRFCFTTAICVVVGTAVFGQNEKKPLSAGSLPPDSNILQQTAEHLLLQTAEVQRDRRTELQRSYLYKAANQNKPNAFGALKKGYPTATEALKTAQVCQTVSGRNFFRQDSVYFYSAQPIVLHDGNVLLSGQYVDYHTSAPLISGGFCMKTDHDGNLIWGKLYDSTQHLSNDYLNIFRSLELVSGDLLLVGRTTNKVSGNDDMVLFRVDAKGNIIWSKTYASRIWQGFNGSGDVLIFNDLKEDPQTGDIYFSTGHLYRPSTITVVDGTNGTLRWSVGYPAGDTDFPFGFTFNNDNTLTLFQHVYTNYNGTFLKIITLDKSKGDVLKTKLYQQPADNSIPRFFSAHQVTKLNNGHYILTGPTTLYYEFPAFTGTKDLYHAALVELDSAFQLVRSYGFKNRIPSLGGSRISMFPDGTGIFTMLNQSLYYAEAHIAFFNNGALGNQRMRIHPNEGINFEPYTLKDSAGRYLNIKTLNDSANTSGLTGGRIDYYSMSPFDQPSVCIGLADTTTSIWNLNFYPANTVGNSLSVEQNIFSESRPRKWRTSDFTAHIVPVCQTVSFCDSLSLSVKENSVCLGSDIILKVYKNKECGAAVPLLFDSSAVSSVKRLSDSSYAFRFMKPGNFQISAGMTGCNIKNASVNFQIFDAKTKTELDKVAELCTGSKMVLHAGAGFSDYTWQDNSKDSVFTASTPGKYYVTVSNACGVHVTDTIQVNAAPAIQFQLPDTITKCNKDSVILTMPAGYIQYEWTPAYAISDATASKVSVFPDHDMMYHIKGEKTAGCSGIDSVWVKVNQSPAIHLGNDTVVCSGQPLKLSAGDPAFVGYQWSNGATGSSLLVTAANMYSVIAVTNFGCISKDTVVVSAAETPFFNLGKDTVLCDQQSLLLSVNVPGNYTWQNNVTGKQITITQAGMYSLSVNNKGCAFADTISVQYQTSPIVKLPGDTLLCDHATLELDVEQSGASYLWDNGTTSPKRILSVAGIYRVQVTKGYCSAADTMIITTNNKPTDKLSAQLSKCEDESVIVSAASGTAGEAYMWQDGSTMPTFKIEKAGVYVCTVTNACGTVKGTVVATDIKCECKPSAPNSFSPNGDGINDYFIPQIGCNPFYYLITIFDRSGNIVFESGDINKPWNGTVKGTPAPSGVYYYTIAVKSSSVPQLVKFSGYITLLR